MADLPLEKTAITLDDLLLLGEDARIEVINGEIIYMSPVGVLHHIFAGNGYDILKAFVMLKRIGAVFFDGLLYLMHEQSKWLRYSFVPDVSFIHASSIPANWDITKPHPGVPDLAVEVISPGDNADEVQAKIRAYLDKGTEQVWVLYPTSKEVHQYRRDADPEIVRIYRGSETIDTESFFPGLELTLDAIFALPDWAQKP